MSKYINILAYPFSILEQNAYESLKKDSGNKAYNEWIDALCPFALNDPQAFHSYATTAANELNADKRTCNDSLEILHCLSDSNLDTIPVFDTRAIFGIEYLLANLPELKVHVFYADPDWLITASQRPMASSLLLDTWEACSKQLLKVVRRFPSRILLHNLEETIKSNVQITQKFESLSSIFKKEANEESITSVTSTAITCLWLSQRPAAKSVMDELHSRSEPLTDSLEADCLNRYSLKQLLIKYDETNKDNAAGSTDGHLKVANELLLLHLHQLQEELEREFIEHKDTQKKLSEKFDQLTIQSTELLTKNQGLESLKIELDRAEEKYGDIVSQLTICQKDNEQANESLKFTEKEQIETKEENDLLLLHLHQVQEELEHVFLENCRLERERLNGCFNGARHLQLERLRLGHCHDRAPHRHLDFTLDKVHIGDRKLSSVRLRMVEHHGRPGMVVFQNKEKNQFPIEYWEPNGEENGVPYMLIVPQDDRGKKILEAFPSSDLLLIRESAQILTAELNASAQKGSASLKRNWSGISRRFVEVMDEITAKLHSDDVEISSHENALKFVLRNAWTRTKGLMPSLEFSWIENSIEISISPGADFPLTNFSNDLLDTENKLVIDLSTRGNSRDQRKFWRGLTNSDRQWIQLLVAELPIFITKLPEKSPDLNFNFPALRKKAHSMAKHAQVLATGRKPNRILHLLRLW
jgi:hypothetical protein